MSAVASAMATAAAAVEKAAAATASSSPKGPKSGDDSQGECQLLGSFALIVQAALGALALMALVYKRWRERPQRPLKIWYFDVSKQVFGSVLVHMSNIFMSMLTSGRFSIKLEPAVAQRLLARGEYVPNPCSFYLLNLAIDVSEALLLVNTSLLLLELTKLKTTIGIPILIILLRVFTGLATYTPFGKPAESVQSGHYGNPPNAVWWLKQSLIYFSGLFGMKLCVLIIFIMMPWISQVGDWALRWTEGNEKLQVAFVMMIFPLIMNALQYYIIDSFIKKKVTEHESVPSEDPDIRYDDDHSLLRVDAADDESVTNDEVLKPHNRTTTVEGEYDPEVDGDAPTVIGSSSSRQVARPRVVQRELLPKE